MTVARISPVMCAAWTFLDENNRQDWKLIVRVGSDWMEVDGGGVSYERTAAKLREFIDDWIADAAEHEPESMPSDDTIEVYRLAAQFIEAHT